MVFQSGAFDLVADDRNFAPDVFVAHLPVTDVDKDGLEDGWEIAHFGSLSASAQDDRDGDGISNLAEYLAGTDPKNGQSRFLIQSAVASSDGKLRITWSTAPGKAYQLQFRKSLASGPWTNVGTPTVALGSALSTDVESSAGNGFYRMMVSQ